MKKAFTTKAFTLFTVLFVLIAAFSFATFKETEQVCKEASKKCSQATPSKKSSEMLWDGFSRRFITLISIN
jgi:hypothetical protein